MKSIKCKRAESIAFGFHRLISFRNQLQAAARTQKIKIANTFLEDVLCMVGKTLALILLKAVILSIPYFLE